MIQSGSLRRSARLAALGQKRRGRRWIGIIYLPPELRQMVVRELIHAAKGPEVYVGKGSRLPVLMEPIIDTRSVPLFHSSVTDTMEIGFPRDYSHLPTHHEQSWAPAYRKLRPLMACKGLYYEATAIFFREKHFVLGRILLKPEVGRSLEAASLVDSLPNPGINPRKNVNSTDKRSKGSTYAHAWLRRIGQRNQVNLRNIRLKIHKELTSTGGLNASGSLWFEVLKKLARSARDLRVLGFQFDDDVDLWRCSLLRSFLRMKSFQRLDQIDFFHCLLPSRIRSEEFLAMIATSTGCASIRCLELSDTEERGFRLIRRASHGNNGQILLSEEI
ncbi:hypothetical protein INS49_012681 [Diaporthe citri]|uniref:uncharacterized protein n=1 Tax=Diaporthe citri TaxID=83186 RepID=UPI001C7F2C07|nr:uncharacterized protein INS49_012681 [Diaporthe citri]KAG6359161.1 hypothetical protein INS49_012681 [Diaporthe citri]